MCEWVREECLCVSESVCVSVSVSESVCVCVSGSESVCLFLKVCVSESVCF